MKNTTVIGFIVVIVLLAGGLLLYRYQRNTLPVSQPTTEQGTITNVQVTPGTANNNATPTTLNFDSTNQISLTVSQPVNNTVVKTPTITVMGKTIPNADVTVNDKDLKADAQGNFSVSITLDEGDNTVIVVANDAQGNSAEKDINVTYDAGNQYQ